jgi:hypothetical protein
MQSFWIISPLNYFILLSIYRQVENEADVLVQHCPNQYGGMASSTPESPEKDILNRENRFKKITAWHSRLHWLQEMLRNTLKSYAGTQGL